MDSGSSSSLFQQAFVDVHPLLKKACTPLKNPVKARAVNNSPVIYSAKISCPITINGDTFLITGYVSNNICIPVILGLDFLKENNICLKFTKNTSQSATPVPITTNRKIYVKPHATFAFKSKAPKQFYCCAIISQAELFNSSSLKIIPTLQNVHTNTVLTYIVNTSSRKQWIKPSSHIADLIPTSPFDTVAPIFPPKIKKNRDPLDTIDPPPLTTKTTEEI